MQSMHVNNRIIFIMMYGKQIQLNYKQLLRCLCFGQTLFSGAQQQDKGQQAQTEALRSSTWTWVTTSSLWGWRSTGTGFPGRLWILLLCRSSRPAWTRSCAPCCRWPCFDRGVGPDDPQRSLPTPNILWFCEIRTVTFNISLGQDCEGQNVKPWNFME